MTNLRIDDEYQAVLDVVDRLEPATAEEVREGLGLPWEKRGTVRNRLYELEDQGLVISDEERPMHFAINEDRRPERADICEACNDDRHPLAVILEEAMSGDIEQWWWLSSADAERPEGSQFLGVAVVQAPGIVAAAGVAHRKGINPGGEVAGIPLPPEAVPAEQYRNRPLGRTEIEEAAL